MPCPDCTPARIAEIQALICDAQAELAKCEGKPLAQNKTAQITAELSALNAELLTCLANAAAVPSPDYEYIKDYVCDPTTNTRHCIVTPFIDGVAQPVIDTDLNTPCDADMPIEPQVEKIAYCNTDTNTIHNKVCLYTFTDPSDLTQVTETVLSDVDTGVPCVDEPETTEDVTIDCDGNTVSEVANNSVIIKGATRAIPVRLEEDCTGILEEIRDAISNQDGTENLDDFCYSNEVPEQVIDLPQGSNLDGVVAFTNFDGNGSLASITVSGGGAAVNDINSGGVTGALVSPGLGAATVQITFTPAVPLTELNFVDVAGNGYDLLNISPAPVSASGSYVLSGSDLTISFGLGNQVGAAQFDGSLVQSVTFDIPTNVGGGGIALQGLTLGASSQGGAAYKLFDEDGNFLEYRDRVTDAVVDASLIIECPAETQEVSGAVSINGNVELSPDCKNTIVTGIGQEFRDALQENSNTTTCFEDTANINNGGNTRNVGVAITTVFSYTAPQAFILKEFDANFDLGGSIESYTVEVNGVSSLTNGFTWTGTFSQLSNGVFTLVNPLEVQAGDVITFTPNNTTGGRFLRFNFTNTSQVFVGTTGTGGPDSLRVQIVGCNRYQIVEDSNGDKTGTDDDGNALSQAQIANIEATATQIDCDGADDVTIVGGEVSITSECKQELADLIADAICDYELTSEVCYELPVDASTPHTREVIISNLDEPRGPIFPAAGSNNIPWNNGPVFQMNGGDGLPVYDSYELVRLTLRGDVGTVTTQPTQLRSNSATFTGAFQSPIAVGADQDIIFDFDPGQIRTNLGTDGVGALPLRVDPVGLTGQMAYVDTPVIGNQMTSGGGTAGQELFGELVIRVQVGEQVTVRRYTCISTGETKIYRVDADGTVTEIPDVPADWTLCPEEEEAVTETEIVGLTKTVTRTSGTNIYAANYRSLSVTAFSDDVTIDGQAIPSGFTWSIDSNRFEQFVNDTAVTGTDYIVTEVR